MTITKTTEILIVDDDPDAVDLFRIGLKQHNVPHNLTVFHDPEKAMQILDDAEEDDLPDLIVLDLNMPRVAGHELLAFLKVNKKLRHIPVIILTVSQSKDDTDMSYHLGAVRYLNKPWEAQGWKKVADTIAELTGPERTV